MHSHVQWAIWYPSTVLPLVHFAHTRKIGYVVNARESLCEVHFAHLSEKGYVTNVHYNAGSSSLSLALIRSLGFSYAYTVLFRVHFAQQSEESRDKCPRIPSLECVLPRNQKDHVINTQPVRARKINLSLSHSYVQWAIYTHISFCA